MTWYKCGITAISVFIVSLLFHGCAAAPSRFYILNALERSETPRACRDERTVTIGINPVDLPRYLNRPQIMTRATDNELMLSEHNLWAEPLKEALPRVIAQNLSSLLCADVLIFPWSGPEQVDYRLTAEVIRLDCRPGGDALLEMQWSVMDEHARKVLISRESRFTEQVSVHDYPAFVRAYSSLLASLSREMADAFKSVTRAGQNQ
ncbi:MAG TPA: PqiC family protein [Desulfomonilia bacterium]|nr:PqiC family protein [Desulfomonilia bacterium]